jgi:hypothetical protein
LSGCSVKKRKFGTEASEGEGGYDKAPGRGRGGGVQASGPKLEFGRSGLSGRAGQ